MRPQEWQTLSAYIDNQLSPKELSSLENQLSKNKNLQKALEELKQTKVLLRKLPTIRVPHNFTLSPEMVASQSPSLGRLFPVFSLSSALATVLLVVSIVFQWNIGASPMALQAKMESADTAGAYEMAAEEESTPAIILWGQQSNAKDVVDGRGGSGGGSDPAPLAMSEAQDTFGGLMEEEPATAEIPIEEQLAVPAMELPQAEDNALDEAPPQPESLPAEESAPQMMEAAPQELRSAKQDGEGPILGIPSKEDEGKILSTTDNLEEVQPVSLREPGQFPILQTLFGILALISGIAAFLTHRKNLS